MVMNIFSKKCPKCGKPVKNDARFCGECGQPLGGGIIKCAVCGTENNSDASFCKKCGRPLAESGVPEIQRHHWARKENDFAVRMETNDMPGMLRKGLIIEPGLNALLIERGVTKGTIPSGTYVLERPEQKLWDWMTTGIPERATLLLVEVTPTELIFNLGGRFTSDPLPIGMNIRMQVEVADPGKFIINLLKGRERLTKDDLREYLYPEVVATADQWLRGHSLKELAENPAVKNQLDIALEETMKKTFQQVGLVFMNIRAVELNLEPYDKIKGVRGKIALLNMSSSVDMEFRKTQAATDEEAWRIDEQVKLQRAQEEADLRKNWGEIQKSNILEDLAEETRKVEKEEARVDLFQRMRQTVLSDKMNDVRSEAEFDRFMDQIDHQKLLSQKEREDLLRNWKDEGEDHDRARVNLVARSEVELEYELRALKAKLLFSEDTLKVDNEIAIARKRADFEFEQRLKTAEQELELSRKQSEIQRDRQLLEEDHQKRLMEIEHQQKAHQIDDDKAEAEMALELLRRTKEIHRLDEEERLRIQRVDALERATGEQALLLGRLEVEARIQLAATESEMKRMSVLAELGPEALISVSGPEQARLLADLKKTEALKGMTEEQILAMSAKDSPEVAKAFQEKYQAIANGKASEEVKAMYERLMSDKEAYIKQTREDADKHTKDVSAAWEKAADQSTHAMDRMADVAKSFAQGSGSGQAPIIINTPSGAGGPMVVSGPGSQAGSHAPETKLCPQCGRFVPADSKHCEHCGKKFDGMN
jgi:hypothetical protein